MKLYNRELQEIENKRREERITALVQKVVNFLEERYGIPKEEFQEKIDNLSIVERKPNESYFVEENGEKVEKTNGKDVDSFVIIKKQDFDGEKWIFENAIYMDDVCTDHTVMKEILHYLSSNPEMAFNDVGIAYDKTGVDIVGYNKNDITVDETMTANGINEGITELLASQAEGKITSLFNYAYQVCIADILISQKNNTLVKAYFSKDEKDFKRFLKDFEQRQKILKGEELITVKAEDSFENVKDNVFESCIEYALSFCENDEEYSKEKQRILQIITSMGRYSYKVYAKTKEFVVGKIPLKEELEKKKNRAKNSKLKFIQGFINAYDDTETLYQYEIRRRYEDANIQKVQEIIQDNELLKVMESNLEEKWRGVPKPENPEFEVKYSQDQVIAMIRLLKAAKLLTDNRNLNPDGINYLEEFSSVPDIKYTLKQMGRNKNREGTGVFQLRKQAKENRKNREIPNFPKTPGEIEAEESLLAVSNLVEEQNRGKLSINAIKADIKNSKITTTEAKSIAKEMLDRNNIKAEKFQEQVNRQNPEDLQQEIDNVIEQEINQEKQTMNQNNKPQEENKRDLKIKIQQLENAS